MKKTKNEKDWRTELEQVAQHLRDPVRMRLAVAVITLVVMFFAVSEPLHGNAKQHRRDLQQLKDKVKMAEEVQLLQDSLDRIDPQVMKGEGNDVVSNFFIELFRQQPSSLLQIHVEPPKRLGPIYSVRVSLDIEGEFNELNQAVHRLESESQLLRVESLHIRPSQRGTTRPLLQLSVKVLKEKA